MSDAALNLNEGLGLTVFIFLMVILNDYAPRVVMYDAENYMVWK